MNNTFSYKQLLHKNKVKVINGLNISKDYINNTNLQYFDVSSQLVIANMIDQRKYDTHIINNTYIGILYKPIHEIQFLCNEDDTLSVIIVLKRFNDALNGFKILTCTEYVKKVSLFSNEQLLKIEDNIDDFNKVLKMDDPILFRSELDKFYLQIDFTRDILYSDSKLHVKCNYICMNGFDNYIRLEIKNNTITTNDFIYDQFNITKKLTLDDIDDQKMNKLFIPILTTPKKDTFIIKLSVAGNFDNILSSLTWRYMHNKYDIYLKNELGQEFDAFKYITLKINGVRKIKNTQSYNFMHIHDSILYILNENKLKNDNIYGQLYLCFDVYYIE